MNTGQTTTTAAVNGGRTRGGAGVWAPVIVATLLAVLGTTGVWNFIYRDVVHRQEMHQIMDREVSRIERLYERDRADRKEALQQIHAEIEKIKITLQRMDARWTRQ